MALLTFAMGFMQDGISEMVSKSVAKEPHVDGLLVGLLSAITLLFVIVYYYYVKRLDITKKIAAQPLMQSIHKVLFNGYFVEFFIHYFAKNIVVGSFAKTLNWIDLHIVDAIVNAIPKVSQKINAQALKTDRGLMSDSSGAMVIGLYVILVLILVGGVA